MAASCGGPMRFKTLEISAPGADSYARLLFDSEPFHDLQLPCELRSLRGSFRELRSMSGYGTKQTNSIGRCDVSC